MAFKDYMKSDAKKVLMDINEFAVPAIYHKNDGTNISVIVRMDLNTNAAQNPNSKLRSVEKNVIEKRRTYYLSSDFQPLVGENITIENEKYKIVPPIQKEAGLWIITVAKSGRKIGIRSV